MGRLFQYKRLEVNKTQNNNNENIKQFFKYGLKNSNKQNPTLHVDNYAKMYATDKEKAQKHKQWWQQIKILGTAHKTAADSKQCNYYPSTITKAMLMRDCDFKQNNIDYEPLEKDVHQKLTKKRFFLNCWQKTSTSTNETNLDDYYVEIESERPEYKQNFVNDRSAILKHQELRHTKLVKKGKRKNTSKLSLCSNTVTDTTTSELNVLLATNWYQPQLNCKTAATRLRYSTPGEFIVCQKAAGSLQLCLRVSNKVKQYSLIHAQSHYKLKGAKKHFNTLSALITHHSVMAEQLPLTLCLPFNDRTITTTTTTKSRNSDDFVNLETLKILQKLQNWEDLY